MKKRNKPIMKPPVKDPFMGAASWRTWHEQNYGRPYRPSDFPIQEDWESVARKFSLDVHDLITYNFLTRDTDAVNYYLHHFGGFNKVSPSGNNIMFHRFANPGIIYIPPPETVSVDFGPEEICVWVPKEINRFVENLQAVAKTIGGEEGKRLRRLLQVVVRVGYPACLDLWYYNDVAVKTFVDIKTSGATIGDMMKSTNQTLPFDGDSGLYSQGGSEERSSGKWRIHPIREIFENYKCGWKAQVIKIELERIDRAMFTGWNEMSQVDFKTQLGGASAFHPMVPVFVDHVRRLAQDKKHLYWAFGN